jgi:hypothetical protein
MAEHMKEEGWEVINLSRDVLAMRLRQDTLLGFRRHVTVKAFVFWQAWDGAWYDYSLQDYIVRKEWKWPWQ